MASHRGMMPFLPAGRGDLPPPCKVPAPGSPPPPRALTAALLAIRLPSIGLQLLRFGFPRRARRAAADTTPAGVPSAPGPAPAARRGSARRRCPMGKQEPSRGWRRRARTASQAALDPWTPRTGERHALRSHRGASSAMPGDAVRLASRSGAGPRRPRTSPTSHLGLVPAGRLALPPAGPSERPW